MGKSDYIKDLEKLTIYDCIVAKDVYSKSDVPLKYLFIDFDGTVRKSVDNRKNPAPGYAAKYPRRPPFCAEEINIFKDVVPKLQRWIESGYRVVGVTNQSGVEFGPTRGGFTVDTCKELCLETTKRLGVNIPVVFAPCKSVNPNVCKLRKPNTGMIELVEDLFGPIDKENSFLVGDFKTDIQMGEAAGLNTFLVDNKKNGSDFPEPADV